MFSFAGIGVDFRGNTFVSQEEKAAGISLRTRWIIFGWVPLVPIGSYKIRKIAATRMRRARFELVSKEPLAIRQVAQVWLATIAIILVGWLLFEVLKAYA